MLEVVDVFFLQLPSPSCLDITFSPTSHHLWPQQTGFKPQHGTDTSIYLLKQTAHYFVSNTTLGFAAILKRNLKNLIKAATTYRVQN